MDRRDYAGKSKPWYDEFDENKMLAMVDNEKVVCIFEICDTCDGKGTHVNPSIDSHGLTREDFDDDAEFRENYSSGMYDVRCYECNGRRVVPVPSPYANSKEILTMIQEKKQAEYDYQMECEAERRMGA